MARTSKKEQSQETRANILAAAAHSIARSGVRGLRLDEVAKEADVAVSLIYYYFKSREDLVQATLQRANELAMSKMQMNNGVHGNGLEQLAGLLIGEFSEDEEVRDIAVVWSEATACAAFDEILIPYVREATQTWFAIVLNAIEKGQADGSVMEELDATACAERLTVLVEGLSSKWLAKVYSRGHILKILSSALEVEFGRRPPVFDQK